MGRHGVCVRVCVCVKGNVPFNQSWEWGRKCQHLIEMPPIHRHDIREMMTPRHGGSENACACAVCSKRAEMRRKARGKGVQNKQK